MATPNASLSIKYSHTLWSPSDTVKDVAEVLGISNLPDDVAKSLAMEVEYRIHEVVEQAMKSMRHSRRTTLTTNDISHALRVLNVEVSKVLHFHAFFFSFFLVVNPLF